MRQVPGGDGIWNPEVGVRGEGFDTRAPSQMNEERGTKRGSGGPKGRREEFCVSGGRILTADSIQPGGR